MATVNGNGNGRKPDWAGHTFVLALVFGIGGAIMTAIGLALQDTRVGVHGLQARELTNAFERGQLTERIGNHGASLVKLDETLQREMRLLDDAMQQYLIDLDHRLQGEISRAAMVGSEDRTALRALLTEVRQYQDGSRGLNTEQTERLRALERAVYGNGSKTP